MTDDNTHLSCRDTVKRDIGHNTAALNWMLKRHDGYTHQNRTVHNRTRVGEKSQILGCFHVFVVVICYGLTVIG